LFVLHTEIIFIPSFSLLVYPVGADTGRMNKILAKHFMDPEDIVVKSDEVVGKNEAI
jgi:hypothetical protein